MAARSTAGYVAAAGGLCALVLALLRLAGAHDGNAIEPFLLSSERAAALREAGLPSAPAPNDEGYDGQFYLVLALDPLSDVEQAEKAHPALSSYRARRILWSALAWASGLGRPWAVVAALYLWQVVLVGLGSWALAKWAEARGASPGWGILFPVQLGVVVSVWRMVGDAIFAALLVATVLALRSDHRRSAVSLGGALLQKELALLAVPVAFLAQRGVPGAGRWLATALALPVAWWTLVEVRLGAVMGEPLGASFELPLAGLLAAVLERARTSTDWVRHAKDFSFLAVHALAIGAGLVAGVVAARAWASRRSLLPASLVAGGYAVLGLLLGRVIWAEPWAYARVLLPLVLICFMASFEVRAEKGPAWCASVLAAPALAGGLLGPAYAFALVALGRP